MAIKILHTADLHIGAEMNSFGTAAGRRRAELLLSLKKTAELCKSEKADLWLIAGDLFDSNSVGKEEIAAVKSAFASVPQTAVCIVPGNHDYIAADSPYTEEFSANVHIFKESGYFDVGDARIYGVPFTSSHSDTLVLPRAEGEHTNILLLHADLDGGMYNPVTPSILAKTKMDYVALGHVHKNTPVLCENGVYYAYSGCPESHGFDEVGEKGVYLGSVEKGNVNLSFVPTAIRNCFNVEIDLTDTADNDGAITKIENLLVSHKEDGIRATLKGSTEYALKPDYIAAALENKVFALRLKDKTVPAVNVNLLRKEKTLRGYFTDIMCNLIEQNGSDEQLETALRLGLDSFCGRGVEYRED